MGLQHDQVAAPGFQVELVRDSSMIRLRRLAAASVAGGARRGELLGPARSGGAALSWQTGWVGPLACRSELALLIYIGQVVVPPAVAEKIGSKHGLSEQDVRDAVQWPARVLQASWLEPPDDPRGPRLVVKGLTGTGRLIKVVLYPVDQTDGIWRLGTAHP